jgi:hypothetical protein
MGLGSWHRWEQGVKEGVQFRLGQQEAGEDDALIGTTKWDQTKMHGCRTMKWVMKASNSNLKE